MDRGFRKLKLAGVFTALALAGYATLAQAGPVNDQMLAADPGESWLHANGNWAAHRYSTLTNLNTANAKDLKVAWVFSAGGKNDAQNTPLFHDGKVFFAQDNKVYALDPTNGNVIWKYDTNCRKTGAATTSVSSPASTAAWRSTGIRFTSCRTMPSCTPSTTTPVRRCS